MKPYQALWHRSVPTLCQLCNSSCMADDQGWPCPRGLDEHGHQIASEVFDAEVLNVRFL
jgi:hypothetical protein